ncbi:hypothetical protein ACQVP2_34650 [Methylobacterium aquaticum]|uniref:hypothetical protein n=1 Tax=Methylobacterium aquaticum TaxID=270351 RepID=UPI003D16EACF
MTQLNQLDLSLALKDPAFALAVDFAREGKKYLEQDPSIAAGDPDTFMALLTIYAFGSADGNARAFVRRVKKRTVQSYTSSK